MTSDHQRRVQYATRKRREYEIAKAEWDAEVKAARERLSLLSVPVPQVLPSTLLH